MDKYNINIDNIDDIELRLARDCIICKESYFINPNDKIQICPRCIKRLKQILYPTD